MTAPHPKGAGILCPYSEQLGFRLTPVWCFNLWDRLPCLLDGFPGFKPGQHVCKIQGAGHGAHYGKLCCSQKLPIRLGRHVLLQTCSSNPISGLIVLFQTIDTSFALGGIDHSHSAHVKGLIEINGKVAEVYISQSVAEYRIPQSNEKVKDFFRNGDVSRVYILVLKHRGLDTEDFDKKDTQFET